MKDEELIWKENSSRTILSCPVYDIREKNCVSAEGVTGNYYVTDAPDWVVIIPVIDDDFLLVRQWRHGISCMTTEFPGGVVEKDEDVKLTALRELREETGFKAKKITKLGEVNPNPALFSNHFSVFLAEDLVPDGEQELDEDEYINCLRVPIKEVIENFGTGEYIHAFMGTALSLYMRK